MNTQKLGIPAILKGVLLSALFLAQGAAALEPIPSDYRGSRTGAGGIDPELAISSESLDPALVPNLYAALRGKRAYSSALRPAGLPSKGSPRMLILLVDFDDYPARPSDTTESMRERIFGAGGTFPYESLTAYYRRSSFGKLQLQGDVLGWYRAGPRSAIPQTREGRDGLIEQALLSFKDLDLSRYDNDGDGRVDNLAVIWTGPTGEWATFWWGCATRFADRDLTIGGVGLGSYSWQPVLHNYQAADAPFLANTLIHETGHALGLPDYYDYKPGEGPDGGLGRFGMMDSSSHDHNCFSKIALGWIEPKVVTFDGEVPLGPAADYGDCVLAVPAGQDPKFFGEYFLIERRVKLGNDAAMRFEGGFVVWHVDARRGPDGALLYNNQTAEHKLLKFVEADGLEELESGARKTLTQEDFFAAGGSFGTGTGPSAALYAGVQSGLSVLFSGVGQNAVSFKYAPLPVYLAAR